MYEVQLLKVDYVLFVLYIARFGSGRKVETLGRSGLGGPQYRRNSHRTDLTVKNLSVNLWSAVKKIENCRRTSEIHNAHILIQVSTFNGCDVKVTSKDTS